MCCGPAYHVCQNKHHILLSSSSSLLACNVRCDLDSQAARQASGGKAVANCRPGICAAHASALFSQLSEQLLDIQQLTWQACPADAACRPPSLSAPATRCCSNAALQTCAALLAADGCELHHKSPLAAAAAAAAAAVRSLQTCRP